MQIVNLYRYTREDGGTSVSPARPDSEYTAMYRIIADEGKEVSHDGENWTRCTDSEYADGWQERTAEEPSDEATIEDYQSELNRLGVDVHD